MRSYPEWSNEQWAEAVERLTLYAHSKMARLCWRGVRFNKGGRPPGSPGPEDIAQEAICAVIEGDRTWNESAYPDFQRFLESVVDSKISALVNESENRRTRSLPDKVGESVVIVGRQAGGQRVPPPDEAILLADGLNRFQREILKALGEDALALGILNCLREGFSTPAEMAVLLEVDVEEIYKAQKRYWRKIEPILRKCMHDWQ